MIERQSVLFTAHSHQILSDCVHLLGVSVLSHCLSRRIPPFSCWKQWTNMPWGRVCVILLLIDSWLFVFFTGILVNGVGLSYSQKTCAMGIYACISFYALSKVLIYGFLVEKVYIVWSGGNQTPRFSTPAYRICSVVLLGYVTVLVLMILGQNSLIRGDGMCIIGLKNFATIPMISYDLFLNVFLTGMFIYPLWRADFMSHMLKNIATRTLCAACASLLISAANIAILTLLKGKEYGWVCLGSCVTDVTLNAIALSWVTSTSYSQSPVELDRFSLPTMDVGVLTNAHPDSEQTKDLGSVTHTTLRDLPESYYDYIPRHSASPFGAPVPAAPQVGNKTWFSCFKEPLERNANSVQSSNVTAHFTPTDPRHAIEESDGVAVGDRASAGVNEKADDS